MIQNTRTQNHTHTRTQNHTHTHVHRTTHTYTEPHTIDLTARMQPEYRFGVWEWPTHKAGPVDGFLEKMD